MRQVVITFHNCRLHGDNVKGRKNRIIKRSRYLAQSKTRCVNLSLVIGRRLGCTRWLCMGRRYVLQRSVKKGKDIMMHICNKGTR